MEPNNEFINDAMWNELSYLIQSFLEGRIKTIQNNGNIHFCEAATKDVTFTYFQKEMYVEDTKINTFVKNIMLTLRDKESC